MTTVRNGKKRCTKCKKNKLVKFFRTRTQKRKGVVYKYLNSSCRVCEANCAREYWDKRKDDPLFKKKNSQNAKRYTKVNQEKVKEQKKKYRERPGGKLHRKEYDKQHKKRIAMLNRLRNVKYVRKNIAAISDQYVLSQLRSEWFKKFGVCAGIIFTKAQIRERKVRIATNRIKKLIKKL